MEDIIKIIGGLLGGTSFVAVASYTAAYFKAKKDCRTGPRVRSLTGELNISTIEKFWIFMLTWVISIATFVITAFSMAGVGKTNVMSWSIILAGVISFNVTRKAILYRVDKHLRQNENQ